MLDKPSWVPGWVPHYDDEASMRRLRRHIAAVLLAGVLAFVVRGADRPPDPFVEPATTSVTGG